MAKKAYQCPSCKALLIFEKGNDEQMVICPKCNYKGQAVQFEEIPLKKIYCPACDTGLQVSLSHKGDITCPKCKKTAAAGDYRETPRQQEEETDTNTHLGDKNKLLKPGVLLLVEGECHPAKIVLQKGRNSIGRKSPSSKSSIQLETPDGFMSKNHIYIDLIMKPDYTFEHRLSDNRSTNGAYHNKERIEPEDVIILRPGDLIRIGHTTFKFIVE
jgi:pSer/pThr/pTyr-binding forkhead associated (FHA) protein